MSSRIRATRLSSTLAAGGGPQTRGGRRVHRDFVFAMGGVGYSLRPFTHSSYGILGILKKASRVLT
jgi:hypothetical protein